MNKLITLRRIEKKDLEWARKLRNENRKHFFDDKLISKKKQELWYKKLAYPFFIIEYEGMRAGVIGIKKSRDGAELTNVVIKKKYRRTGILKETIAILEKKFEYSFFLKVKAENENAIIAYKKLGFYFLSHEMRKR